MPLISRPSKKFLISYSMLELIDRMEGRCKKAHRPFSNRVVTFSYDFQGKYTTLGIILSIGCLIICQFRKFPYLTVGIFEIRQFYAISWKWGDAFRCPLYKNVTARIIDRYICLNLLSQRLLPLSDVGLFAAEVSFFRLYCPTNTFN